MALTLTEIIAEIRSHIKRDATSYDDARITTRVNWGQERVADLHTFEEMKKEDSSVTTVAGQKTYNFPARMKDIYTIRLQDGGNSRKLIYVHPKEFYEVIPYPEHYTTGRPRWYVDYGITYNLHKIPDTAYTLHRMYSQYPADLSSSIDTSVLLRKDKLIIAAATAFCFLDLREPDLAEYWGGFGTLGKSIFGMLFKEALSSDHSAEDWTPQARGFTTAERVSGDYWKNPLYGL